MQGTPFYDVLANQFYADDFSYIGPTWDEREKLILDGDDDHTNNTYQSDIVSVLLNLSAVPD